MKLMQTQNSAGYRPKLNANPRAGAGCTTTVRPRVWAAALLGVLGLLAVPGVVRAQDPGSIPAAINYQGRLTDKDGNPVGGGYYEVWFRIWDNQSQSGAGNYIWGRAFPLNVVTNGIFNVLLTDDGSQLTSAGNPSAASLLQAFQGPNRYLGLSVSRSPQGQITSPEEITPRQQLVTAPFAIHAFEASQAGSAGFATNATQAAFAASAGTGKFYATNGLQVAGQTSLGGIITVSGTVTLPAPESTFNGGFVPIGGIIMWNGSTAPKGWALCDGNNGTPDLTGRFVLGTGSGKARTPRTFGDSGGLESVTLLATNLPPHTHQLTVNTYGYIAINNGNKMLAMSPSMKVSDGNGAQTFTSDTSSAATGSHENMPPFYALAFIMRVQ